MSKKTQWHGHGTPPYPGHTKARVWFCDGSEERDTVGSFRWCHIHGGTHDDIVAYEVIGDAPHVFNTALDAIAAKKGFTFPDHAVVPTKTAHFDDHEALTFHELGNGDAGGEGKQTNPKDLIGAKKVPLSTLPFRVLWRVGLAMLEGMCKYGRHNYRYAGVRSSVYFDGAMRHLGAWWEGEDIDPDSGFNHIDKLLADLMVMRDSMLEGNFVDDRPPRGKDDFAFLNAEAKRIVEQHADKNPRHFTIADSK